MVAITAACGQATPPPAVAVHDSAGIQIVANHRPSGDAAGAWRVSPQPTLRIGEVEGDSAYRLYRVVDATRLADGRVVIANSGTGELRFHDRSGRYLASAGRPGDGPGEFRYLGAVWRLPGDSLATWDRGNGRFSVFDAAGGFVRAVALQVPSGRVAREVAGLFGDGSLLATGSPGSYGDTDAEHPAPLYVSRFEPDGTFANAFGEMPGVAWFGLGEGDRREYWMVPFAPQPRWAARGDRLYVGTGAEFAIEQWTRAGDLERIIRGPDEDREIGSGGRRTYGDDLRADAADENERRQIERFLEDVPFPERYPAFIGLRTDTRGYLWVERFRPAGDRQPRWMVFDTTGVWLHTVDTPPGVRTVEIGPDYVLGVTADALGVEHVVLYPLERR